MPDAITYGQDCMSQPDSSSVRALYHTVRHVTILLLRPDQGWIPNRGSTSTQEEQLLAVHDS